MRTGWVKQVSGSTYFVADTFSMAHAERSVSCLLQPEKDDLVLISENGLGNAYIITVLERANSQPAMVSVNGDMIINGQGNLSFKGGSSLNLVTPQIVLKMRQARIAFNNFTFAGAMLTSCGNQLLSICENVETRTTELKERVRRLYRRVRDEDSRLDRFTCRVQGRFSIAAQDCSIDAEKQMRLNGNKIELG